MYTKNVEEDWRDCRKSWVSPKGLANTETWSPIYSWGNLEFAIQQLFRGNKCKDMYFSNTFWNGFVIKHFYSEDIYFSINGPLNKFSLLLAMSVCLYVRNFMDRRFLVEELIAKNSRTKDTHFLKGLNKFLSFAFFFKDHGKQNLLQRTFKMG